MVVLHLVTFGHSTSKVICDCGNNLVWWKWFVVSAFHMIFGIVKFSTIMKNVLAWYCMHYLLLCNPLVCLSGDTKRKLLLLYLKEQWKLCGNLFYSIFSALYFWDVFSVFVKFRAKKLNHTLHNELSLLNVLFCKLASALVDLFRVTIFS